jgi:hypothetical protein
MGSPKKTLKLTLSRKVAVLIGVIGIVTSLYTLLNPSYPIYHVWHDDIDVVLYDDFPMLEIVYPFADKVVIEGLTTNGSPILIKVYESYISDTPIAILENVTDVQDVFLVGAGFPATGCSLFRLFRYDNQSVLVNLSYRVWGANPSTDYFVFGFSPFEILIVPLVIVAITSWGQLPDRRGLAILLLLLLGGTLIAPLMVYIYNGWGTTLRYDDVQDVQVHGFSLNSTDPIHEINVSFNVSPESFIRIADLTTGNVTVAMNITLNEDGASLNLSSIRAVPPCSMQFEFPAEGVSGVTVHFARVALDAMVNLSLETVVDVWRPWIDRVPYDLSAVTGVLIVIVALVIPRREESQDSIELSEE